jgi:hypothetical protein
VSAASEGGPRLASPGLALVVAGVLEVGT